MKKSAIVTGILLSAGLLLSPGAIIAQDAAGGKTAAAVNALTQDQQKQLEKLQQKFREDNGESLKQLNAKKFDLKTQLDSEKPDQKKAKALQKEISDLSAVLAQKSIDLYFEVRAITPDAKFKQ